MFHLLYTSTASRLLSADELKAILVVARKANEACDVTGILLYCDGSFMQLLEGDETTVRALYEKICRDPRHLDVQIVATIDSAERWCGDWSMGFSYCSNKGEMEACVNLAKGTEPVRDKLGDANPLRDMLLGFVDRNLRLFES